MVGLLMYNLLFLSTLSLRRATSQQPRGTTRTTYFYPRSPCGERQPALYQLYDTYAISIHALLAESDWWVEGDQFFYYAFLSTLSLRRATAWTLNINGPMVFLSTLSLRRATHYDNYNLHCVEISIHALLAESDQSASYSAALADISIHALLAESDCSARIGFC